MTRLTVKRASDAEHLSWCTCNEEEEDDDDNDVAGPATATICSSSFLSFQRQRQEETPATATATATAATATATTMHTTSSNTNSNSNIFWYTRPRILYGTVFVWLSVASGRFLAPFLEHECRLSGAAIGALCGAQYLLGIPGAAWAGRWADRWEAVAPGRGRARVLSLGVVSGTVFFLLHGTHRFASPSFFASTGWFLLLRVLSAASTSMIFPVLDGMCLQYLECTARPKEEFGKERLYGAVSWAVTNLLLAQILDLANIGFAMTYPLSVLSAVALLVAVALYSQQQQQQQQQQQTAGDKYHRIVRRRTSDLPDDHQDQDSNPPSTATTQELLYRLLFGSNRGWYFGCAFVLASTLLAAGQVIVDALVFLFFESLGSSYAVMGWTVVLTVLFEIPIFHIADQLLARFGSTLLLQAAMGCYVTRVIGYSLLPPGRVVYALILEPLHGITFACSVTAAVDFVAGVMPDGCEASGQGMVNAVRGMGSVIGLLLGGWAQDALGPRIMYRSAAAVVFAGSLVLGCASWRSTITNGPAYKHQRLSTSPSSSSSSAADDQEDIELTVTGEDESSSSDSELSLICPEEA